jgi:hypothetical protein
MNIRLLIILFVAVGGIGFEYDPGTGNDVSRYESTRIIVSDGQEPYRVELQYNHTFNTNFSLSIRITNDLYSNALLYTQNFSSARMVTRSFYVPSSMVHRFTQWFFFSQSSLGTKQWILESQPRVEEQVRGYSFNSWESSYGTQEINEVGNVVTQKERIKFEGFNPIQSNLYYGRLSLSHLGLEWMSRPQEWMQLINAYLLIAKDSYFEDLYSWDDSWNYVPLDVYSENQYLRFLFPTLYVHPTRLTMSPLPLQGYVPTSNFYFPLNQFHRFRETTFQLRLMISNLTQVTFSYTFLYDADYPLLGPCSISQFCIRVPNA